MPDEGGSAFYGHINWLIWLIIDIISYEQIWMYFNYRSNQQPEAHQSGRDSFSFSRSSFITGVSIATIFETAEQTCN